VTVTATPRERPLRLVYINPTGALGGAEQCLLDVLASLRSARPDWSLRLVVGDDGPFPSAAAELGVKADVLPMPAALAGVGDSGLSRGAGRGRAALGLAARGPGALASALLYLRQLRRLLRAERPDLVQTNGMKAHVLGAWAAPKEMPVLWQLQDFMRSRPVMARLLKWSSERRLRVIAASKSVAADARAVLGPRVPVETVYSAIDLARFAPGPGNGAWLDALAGLPAAAPGTVRVGLVATYAHWKGHDVFLEAAARLAPELPARFYIIGGPIYRSAGSQVSLEALRARASALGLNTCDRLGFVGHQDEPADVMRTLDVVVHASTQPEPFGRVIVEGMACGRAVVASSAGGAAELFEHEVTALGCPPGDPDALAAALSQLIADPALRQRLGERGRAAAIQRFDRTRLAEEWGRVYAGETAGSGVDVTVSGTEPKERFLP
jgi:glycosyltransferase involved in cell wall biosynthesis